MEVMNIKELEEEEEIKNETYLLSRDRDGANRTETDVTEIKKQQPKI